MQNRRCFLLVMFFLLSMTAVSSTGRAAVVEWQAVQQAIVEKVLEGQNALLERKYAQALSLFQKLEELFPTSPAGYFGEMATYEVQMLEFEDFRLEKEFLDAAKRGEKAISFTLQRYEPSSIELMFCGSLYGMEGFLKARKHEWWGSYILGIKAQQLFHRIKKMDRNEVDADFGIGMYLYWRSVFADRLTSLPIIPNRRAEGIALVQEVAEKGWIAREMAWISLGIMYLEEKRYEDASRILVSYVDRFPQNIILRSFLGRAYIAAKRYDDAIAQFQETLKREPSYHRAHYFIALSILLKKDATMFPTARGELDRFLAAESDHEWQSYGYYWRGVIAEGQADNVTARDEYAKALALNPSLKEAKFHMRGLGGGL